MKVRLSDVCTKGSSSIALKDLEARNGCYPIYGASGFIKNVDFYQQEQSYVAVVKDGAGVGRVMCLPAKSSVIGTMQYIIPNDGVNVEYLTYALEHMNLAKYYTGATIPHIYFKDYCNERLPSHTQEEQGYIANVLNNIDEQIILRKEQLVKLEQLVKSRFVELFGDLLENPYGWPIKKIAEISTLLKSGLSRKLLGDDIGLPVIRSCNIQNGHFQYDDIKYWYVDDPQGAKTSDYILEDGDILINFINSMSQIGKTAIFNDVGRECIYTTNIFRMKLTSNCNKYYYNWFAMTEYYNRQLRSIIQPAVNQASFTTVNFLNLSLPLPPLDLQNQFAAFVEQVDKSKFEIQQSLEKLETLKKSLMQQYFG